MLWLTVGLLAAAQQPISIAAPGLTTVGLEAGLDVLYGEHLAQQLGLRGLRIVTSRDIGMVLGIERQRELLGCKDSEKTSCLAELVNALGADAVLVGEIGKVGRVVQLNLKIISPVNGRTLASHTARVGSLEDVLGALEEAATAMVPVLAAALGRPVPELTAEAKKTLGTGTSAPRLFWVPAALGVVAAGIATWLLVDARAQHGELLRTDGTMLTPTDVAALRERGERNQTIGFVLLGVAGAGVVSSVAWYFLGGSRVSASAWLGRDFGGLAVAGSWP